MRHKDDGSPVTAADLEAERAMRRVLREFDSELPIFGEEFGAGEGNDARGPHGSNTRDAAAHKSAHEIERGWVLDPIDGTLSFTRGLPLFGTLVALFENGAPVLGLIDLPALGARFLGVRGGGAWRENAGTRGRTRLQVSRAREFEHAIVAHGDAYAFERFGARAEFDELARTLGIFRGYSDAFGHAMVLDGAVDVMLDANLKLWDIAATQVLVPEAGGRCAHFNRGARGHALLLGSPALVDALCTRLGW